MTQDQQVQSSPWDWPRNPYNITVQFFPLPSLLSSLSDRWYAQEHFLIKLPAFTFLSQSLLSGNGTRITDKWWLLWLTGMRPGSEGHFGAKIKSCVLVMSNIRCLTISKYRMIGVIMSVARIFWTKTKTLQAEHKKGHQAFYHRRQLNSQWVSSACLNSFITGMLLKIRHPLLEEKT